jgi:hypothetical protein
MEGGGSGESFFFQGETIRPFVCANAKLKGEVAGAKTTSLTDTLERCHEAGLGAETCNTVGAAQGVVVLSGNATPVYISKATKKTALLWSLHKVSVEWRGVVWKISGSLLSPVSPINTETTKFELAWHQSREYQGEEEFMSYENEKGELVRTEFTVNTGPGQVAAALEIPKGFPFTTTKSMKVSA